jgi:hypothetical protein
LKRRNFFRRQFNDLLLARLDVDFDPVHDSLIEDVNGACVKRICTGGSCDADTIECSRKRNRPTKN